MTSADLQHSEGTGLVLVGAQQSQGAPQLHQTPENTQGLQTKSVRGGVRMSPHYANSRAVNAQKRCEGVLIVFQHVKVQRCAHLKHVKHTYI